MSERFRLAELRSLFGAVTPCRVDDGMLTPLQGDFDNVPDVIVSERMLRLAATDRENAVGKHLAYGVKVRDYQHSPFIALRADIDAEKPFSPGWMPNPEPLLCLVNANAKTKIVFHGKPAYPNVSNKKPPEKWAVVEAGALIALPLYQSLQMEGGLRWSDSFGRHFFSRWPYADALPYMNAGVTR